MCCLNIDPQDFLNWANPILEKKDKLLAEVRQYMADQEAKYNALPWYKKLFANSPPSRGLYKHYWESDLLEAAGWYKLPIVHRDKYIPLAEYCKAKNEKMPLISDHDFFKS